MQPQRTMGAGVIVLAALLAAAPSAAEELQLGLVEAVRQALDANPDLAAQRRALAADREEVGLSRSVLLPQVSFGAAGQVLDSDRSDDHRGNVSQESASVQATLSQILNDEESWAVLTAGPVASG